MTLSLDGDRRAWATLSVREDALFLKRSLRRSRQTATVGRIPSGAVVVHESLEAKRHGIEELCRTPSVRRLDLFGSAVEDSFDVETSDVDVLVEFEVRSGH